MFAAEHWGLLRVQLENPATDSRRARVTTRFSTNPNQQFTRTVWLPPRATRFIEWPAYLGPIREEDEFATDADLLLLDADQEIEYGRLPPRGVLLSRDPLCTVSVNDSDKSDDPSSDAMLNARDLAALSRRIHHITDANLPRYATGWDMVDVMSLSKQQPKLDSAQRRTFRAWLQGGGKLVVFANRVDMATMRLLLGSVWDATVIDHVTLSAFQFDRADGQPLADPPEDGLIEVEQPIRMARLHAPSFRTDLTIRGWPALLSKDVGSGKLIVVGINGRAWCQPNAKAALGKLSDALYPYTYYSAPSLSRQQADQFIARKIGYRIAPRTVVGAVLGAFIVLFFAAGIVLHRAGRLERLGPIGVVLALIGVGVLLGIGKAIRGQVPATNAGLQLIRVDAGARVGRVEGYLGLYGAEEQPADVPVTVASDAGGWAMPGLVQQANEQPRLSSIDLAKWQWTGLRLLPGAVRPIDYVAPIEFDRPLDMDLTYGSDGLTGTVAWPTDASVQDAVIATARGRMQVSLAGTDGAYRLAVGPDDVLRPGVWSAEGMITQSRQMHNNVMAGLVGPKRQFRRPTLLAWSEGADVPIRCQPQQMAHKHEALWMTPLQMRPAAPGAEVVVPWPFVAVRDSKASLNREGLRLYLTQIHLDTRPLPHSAAFIGDFTLPAQVQPLKLSRATLNLNISASGRGVLVMTLRDGELVTLHSMSSPDGAYAIDLPVDQLQMDADGSIVLVVEATDASGTTPDDTGGAMWRMQDIGLEVAGTVMTAQP